jgi:hypoxanthine phosphoribosyltransferase
MYYSHQDLISDVHKIADEIIADGNTYDYIVGIARGGLIPAVILSHYLDIPMRSVSWSTFHKDQMREHAYDIAEDIHEGKRILLVDDILDSGRTITELLDDWGCKGCPVSLAVMLYNTDQSIVPNFYGRKFSRTEIPEWIDFWWEK